MADWVYYSSKRGFASAGELLRAIPSSRIWRLERTVVDDGETTSEMVRAAEQLLDLDVTLRLQNEPAAATRLRVLEADPSHRRAFAELGPADFPPAQLQTIAEVSLEPSAIDAGHIDICDDVLAGLEQLYRGGIAHCPRTGEIVATTELRRMLDADIVRCSHLDLELCCDGRQRAYVCQQLSELPPPFGRYLRTEGDTLSLRTRFPATLSGAEIDAVCAVAKEMAKYARSGHVRFRERGVWSHAVEGIGTRVADPPGDTSGVFGRLTRLLRQDR